MAQRFVLGVINLILVLGWSMPASSATQTKIALVVGNQEYTSGPLRNPVNDAKDMAEILKTLGFTVTLKTNLQRREFRHAIRDFGGRSKNARVALFYYAGHGAQVGGKNFLIPVGADIAVENEISDEAVEAGLVLRKMQTAKSAINIVILDACRDNPFGYRFQRGSNRGLARIPSPRGTLIAYSTAPNEVANDGSGRNSVYTKHLLAAIKNTRLPIELMFKQVRRNVQNDPENTNKQTPWEESSLVDSFSFQPAKTQVGHVVAKIQPIESAIKPSVPKGRPAGSIGVSITTLFKGHGVIISKVFTDGNAFKAGIREQDVITRIDDIYVWKPNILMLYISVNAGKTVTLNLIRNGKQIKRDVKIGICRQCTAIESTAKMEEYLRVLTTGYKQLTNHDNEALVSFSKAIELEPAMPVGYWGRVWYHKRHKAWKQMLYDLDSIIGLDNNDINAYRLRGKTYIVLKKEAIALKNYNEAIEIAPNWSAAYSARATFYKGQHDYDRALNDANKVLEIMANPWNRAWVIPGVFASEYNKRGEIYYAMGRYKEAGIEFKKAMELHPSPKYQRRYKKNLEKSRHPPIGDEE